MKQSWESRDWNDSRPEERRMILSPFQMSLLEAAQSGATVLLVGRNGDKNIEFCEFGPVDGDGAVLLRRRKP